MLKKDSPFHHRLFVALAVCVPLLLLLSVGFLVHRSVRSLDRTRKAVSSLQEQKHLVSRLLGSMLDHESGQRGYILAQDELFLQPYYHAREVLPRLRRTAEATFQEAGEKELMRTSSLAMDARLAFAEKSVALEKAGEHEQSVALVRTGEGKRLMDEVRAHLAALESSLTSRQQGVEEKYANNLKLSERVAWFLVLIDCCFFAGLAVVFLRLQRAEQFVHICAWSRTIEYEGEWISFESYLARKFKLNISHGISPEEADKLKRELRTASGKEA